MEAKEYYNNAGHLLVIEVSSDSGNVIKHDVRVRSRQTYSASFGGFVPVTRNRCVSKAGRPVVFVALPLVGCREPSSSFSVARYIIALFCLPLRPLIYGHCVYLDLPVLL